MISKQILIREWYQVFSYRHSILSTKCTTKLAHASISLTIGRGRPVGRFIRQSLFVVCSLVGIILSLAARYHGFLGGRKRRDVIHQYSFYRAVTISCQFSCWHYLVPARYHGFLEGPQEKRCDPLVDPSEGGWVIMRSGRDCQPPLLYQQSGQQDVEAWKWVMIKTESRSAQGYRITGRQYMVLQTSFIQRVPLIYGICESITMSKRRVHFISYV